MFYPYLKYPPSGEESCTKDTVPTRRSFAICAGLKRSACMYFAVSHVPGTDHAPIDPLDAFHLV